MADTGKCPYPLRRLAGVLVFAASLLVPFASASAEPVVIAHGALRVEHIDTDTLRALFGMRLRRWPDGEPVRVYVLPPDSAVHQAFVKAILGVLPHRLERTWQTLVYTGTGQAPAQVDSEQEMLARVAATPGAIGYLDQEPANAQVHVLRIR